MRSCERNVKKAIIISVLLAVCMLAGCSFIAAAEPTPVPTPEPTPEPTPTPVVYESGIGKVRISEIMSKNKATLMDADGDFSDWIEIENICGSNLNLYGWTLSNGKSEWTFPDFTLYSASRAIVFASKKDRADTELHASFKVSEGDTVSFSDRNGDAVDAYLIEKDISDWSVARTENGEMKLCAYPTPGYENTAAGYESFCSARTAEGPLVINEVCVDNFSDYDTQKLGYTDWVEIRNISGDAVDLSQFCISDDLKNLRQYALDGILGAGEKVTVLCDKDASKYTGDMLMAPFSLNSENDRLYLSEASGRIIDYTPLKNIPFGKTFGRIDGKNGFFYMYEKSPGLPNGEGERRVAEAPAAAERDGIYNGVESVTVELSAGGDIYYTLDCTEPTTESAKYSGPITLTETSIVRAISVEPGALNSGILTLSYIINENHTLPVASLVCGSSTFNRIYLYGQKDVEVPGSISFYEDGGSFSLGCGVKLNGASSLVLPKKNLSLRFRGCYGAEKLDYDLFGGGVTSFTNLILRAGQDQNNTIVRNEACYKLAREFSDNILTLRFKYCILYLDGKYNGIYAFIEKPNEQYVASTEGVSKSSVEVLEASIYSNTSLYQDVIGFLYENDVRDPENYAHVCEKLDIDGFIDWTLLQGFLANYDLADGNLRYAKSTENDGKWRMMLYDLDCAFSSPDFIMNNVLIFDNQVSTMNRMLSKSEDYRNAMLARASEAFASVLNTEHMIEIIDGLSEVVAPEVERDRQFSHMDAETWAAHLRDLRKLLCESRWDERAEKNLCRGIYATNEEIARYFGE